MLVKFKTNLKTYNVLITLTEQVLTYGKCLDQFSLIPLPGQKISTGSCLRATE